MYEKALEINDQGYQFWGYLAAAYYWSNDQDLALSTYQQAIQMAEEMRQANPDDAKVLSRLATYYAMIDKPVKARMWIEQALNLAPQDEEVMFRASYTYERLGDRDWALQWMEEALKRGHPRTDAEREPGFRELRDDPRFEILASRP